MTRFGGAFLSPGITASFETAENQFWSGRPEDIKYQLGVIDSTAADAGNTGSTNVLRSGLLLGQITASNKLKQWDPTATDGSENIFGILLHSLAMELFGSNADRMTGLIVTHGSAFLRPGKLIRAANTSLGIVGDDYEHIVRTQLRYRFWFTDHYQGLTTPLPTAKTTDYTVVAADAGALFTTLGAAGAVNFTLPAPLPGLEFTFFNAADQDMTVTAASAGQMIVYNDLAANSVALSSASDKIGGGFKVIGLSTSKWLVVPINWTDGTIAQTITIAT